MKLHYWGGAGLHGGGYPFLWRDEFAVDEASPLATPRVKEAGSGTVLTPAQASIVGAAFCLNGYTSAMNPGIQCTTPQVREAGLCFAFRRGAADGTTTRSEWGVHTHAHELAYTSSGSITYNNVGLSGGICSMVADSKHAIVTYTPGYLAFYQNWLRWVNYSANNTPLQPFFGAYTSLIIGTNSIQYARFKKLLPPWDDMFYFADLNVAAPVSGTEYNGAADSMTDLTITAPNPLSGDVNERAGFYYCTDADLTPSFHIYFDGAGNAKIDSIDGAGVRTNRCVQAAAIAAGETKILRAMHWNAGAYQIGAFVLGLVAANWTRLGGTTFNDATNQAVTRKIPVMPAGWTMANLRNWPRVNALYADTELTP